MLRGDLATSMLRNAHGALAASVIASVVACSTACSGGNPLGATCGGNDDCASSLQCQGAHCVPRCERAPDCGDGYACAADGLCIPATGQRGDTCTSEVDCGPGLSCEVNGSLTDGNNRLTATCNDSNAGALAGESCTVDTDCHNGTCALGRCVDLCRDLRDCGLGTSCIDIPRVEADGLFFAGCLPTQGVLSWSLPVAMPQSEILVPIPAAARSAELVMTVDDPGEMVGVRSVLNPSGSRIYSVPCFTGSDACSQTQALDGYFGNALRHVPGFGQSVLLMPSSPSPSPPQLQIGAYRVVVASFRPDGTPGSSVPRVTAVVKLETGVALDLHFFFLDLTDHPCVDIPGGALSAATAPSLVAFSDDFIGGIRAAFAPGIALGNITYDDITDRPELDGLDVANAAALLSLGKYATGVNIFFVRSLTPLGLAAFGPNPGPAGLAGTPQSGIALSADTLCYSSWQSLALLAAHQVARYMGLYHNVELGTASHPTWRDPIDDGDASANNLMYFAGPTGSELSPGQRQILTRSAVLQ